MIDKILIERDIYASEDHKMVAEAIEGFVKKDILPFHEEWENKGMVDRVVWTKAGELGLLNIDMPVEYGGGGLDYTFSAMFTEILASHGITGPGYSLHSDIVAPYILKHGTEQQKQKYLTKMATGEWIAAIGMTEPSCGSDLKSLRTNAVDKGDYWELNGQKTFITNGFLSDFSIIAARTRPGTAEEGISLMIVDSSLEGFTKGNPFKKIGLKAQDTCELFFDNVKVPKENLLGAEGQGFKIMMTELARERLSVANASIGGALGAIRETIKYVSTRTAFKQPIAGFQNTQFKLAECAAQLQIHMAYVDKCTELVAQHRLSPESASIAKLTTTEMNAKVVDECVQLHGGYGFMWEYMVGRMYCDNRVARIYAGSNEIMKLLISRGLFRDLHQQMKAAKKAKAALV